MLDDQESTLELARLVLTTINPLRNLFRFRLNMGVLDVCWHR